MAKALDPECPEGEAALGLEIATVLAEQRGQLLPFIVEWEDDLDQTACSTGWVSCRSCDGGGKINDNGKPSKRYPPTHKPDCALVAAIGHEADPKAVK